MLDVLELDPILEVFEYSLCTKHIKHETQKYVHKISFSDSVVYL